MRPPSNSQLLKIATFTGLATISGISYFQWALQNRLRESPYCKLAIETLSNNKAASALIGKPITSLGYDLGDSTNNYCNGSQATFQVKIKGSNDKGKMFFWATKNSDNQDWSLDRLEFEIKSQPNRRYVIKRPQETSEAE